MDCQTAPKKTLRTSSFRVEADSIRRLEEIARTEDRSVSSVVRRFLREALERYSQNRANVA